MIDIGKIDQGISLTGSRYLLCTLMAKRAKSLFKRRPRASFSDCVESALNEIIHDKIGFLIPKQFAHLFSNTTFPSTEESSNSNDFVLMSLFALGRAKLEASGWGYVGQTYSIEVGISASQQPQFESYPFDINIKRNTTEIPFDFLIHICGSLKLIGDWQKRLNYKPMQSGSQLLEFSFEIIEEGDNVVKVDCFYERRWLRTMRFEFKGIKMNAFEAYSA